MHDMKRHVREFPEKHGFYGRASEESFESYHVKHKKVAANLKTMRDNKLRTEVTNRRLQMSCDPDTEALIEKIKQKSTGRKRGPYKTTSRFSSLPIVNPERQVIGDSILLHNGIAIKQDWEEVYRMVVAGEVPNSWREKISSILDITDEQKGESMYCN